MYSILSFRNGVDALIATGTIPKGAVRAIRLTLGGNNNAVIDGTIYTLALKNNKVTIRLGDIEKLDLNNLKLNLDFDLAIQLLNTTASLNCVQILNHLTTVNPENWKAVYYIEIQKQLCN